MLRVEFDDAKNEANIAKHRVDLASASDFRFDTALSTRDTRRNYGEEWTAALGFIADTLHVLVFTMRGKALRVISFRRANRKEGMRIMAKRKRPEHISQQDWDAVDSPPLTERVMLELRPPRETFPELAKEAARKRGQRGPQKKPRKVTVSLRLDREIIAAYKASGKGYQSRMAAILEKNARQLA